MVRQSCRQQKSLSSPGAPEFVFNFFLVLNIVSAFMINRILILLVITAALVLLWFLLKPRAEEQAPLTTTATTTSAAPVVSPVKLTAALIPQPGYKTDKFDAATEEIAKVQASLGVSISVHTKI